MPLEITKCRLRRLGHVLRMPNERIPKVALRRQAKNHLAEDSDNELEEMGARSTGLSTSQGSVAVGDCGLMSQLGQRGFVSLLILEYRERNLLEQ